MQVARDADHIVTVSEHSKLDIMRLLGVPEDRITNTYEAVEFPEAATQRPVDAVADHLAGAYGLEYGKYLLFFGAMEPKKNLARLIEAYLAAPVELPLLIVSSGGWQNDTEMKLLAVHGEEGWDRARRREGDSDHRVRRRIQRLEYVGVATLVSLIRGARAVLFPSLYEGFGLPAMEAMTLGTPVVTSRASSLPEIAGDAAILVDPYDVDELSRAIVAISSDDDLHGALVEKGKQQSALFSVDRYQERVAALYAKLL
jgi:glycosyltransferase involved in cell wall biosynthesis